MKKFSIFIPNFPLNSLCLPATRLTSQFFFPSFCPLLLFTYYYFTYYFPNISTISAIPLKLFCPFCQSSHPVPKCSIFSPILYLSSCVFRQIFSSLHLQNSSSLSDDWHSPVPHHHLHTFSIFPCSLLQRKQQRLLLVTSLHTRVTPT